MNTKTCRLTALLSIASVLFGPLTLRADENAPVPLPAPRLERGLSLMKALEQRRSSREFSGKKIPLPVLSDLLWSGFGMNRPESDHRTAPSAMNSQEVDIYLASAEGLWLFEAKPHRLQPVLSEDIRGLTGGQSYVTKAPLALIFVADLSRLTRAKPDQRERYAGIDTGYVSQNIYLFCASEGLATVVHEVSNRKKLAEKMRLRPDQKIILAQSVGYPK